MNIAIIVAAGSGKRFGGGIPKQFLQILGKPLIIYTIERFENCPLIDEIILVLAESEIENFTKDAQKYKLKKLNKIISGGSSRNESVFNGFREINSETAGVVAVHDGARPLVSIEEISGTIKKAEKTGAACLVAKVTDTIKMVSEEKILETIDRSKLRRAMTPQCFRFELLKRAFEENEIGEIATDESFLVEKLGIEVSVVEGSSKNIKVTTPEDLVFVENFLNQEKSKNV